MSDDALRSRGDLGGSQGAVSEELGRMEGVGEAGGDRVTRLEQRGAVAFALDLHRAGDRGEGAFLEERRRLAAKLGFCDQPRARAAESKFCGQLVATWANAITPA
jgi:hypothetical protein